MSIASPTAGDTRLVRPVIYSNIVVDGEIRARLGPAPGWFVSSSTTQQLPATGYVDFYVPLPVVGVIVGLGNDPSPYYTSLSHGLYFTRGMMQPIEGGVLKSSLASYLDSDKFTILIVGTTVSYQKNGTTFYTSATAISGSTHRPYAFLYAANDAVWNLKPTPTLTGTAHGAGYAKIHPAQSLGTSKHGAGFGYASMKQMNARSDNGEIVTAVNGGMGDMKSVRAQGNGPPTDNVGIAAFRPLQALGSDKPSLGIGYATMMPMSAMGTGAQQTIVTIFSGLGGGTFVSTQNALLASILSSLGATMISNGVVQLPNTIFSGVGATDRAALLKVLLSILSGMGITDISASNQMLLRSILSSLGMGDLAAANALLLATMLAKMGVTTPNGVGLLDVPNETWVVNSEKSTSSRPGIPQKNASTRYDNYDFNSMAIFRGVAYGMRADGLYLLQGDDDDGTPIRASINFGTTNFGTSALKSLSAAYANTSTNGKLFMKITQSGQSFIYEARRFDPYLMAQRFDLGRGLRSNYFGLEIFNGPGASMEIDSIEVIPTPLTRRI